MQEQIFIKPKQQHITVRLPVPLIEKLNNESLEKGWTRSQLVKEYITKGMAKEKRGK